RFGGVRWQRKAFDEAKQANGDEAGGARHADPVKNAVHAATSDDWSRGIPNGFTGGRTPGPARGSRPRDGPNLSTSAPCFGQTRLAVWTGPRGVHRHDS